MIDEILKHNEDFVNNGSYLHYSAGKYPRKKLAVLSCMDTRLVELLPAALGIKDGDVKMIKNAGAVITDPFDTTVRSLIIAVLELGVEEIMVITPTNCGVASITPGPIRSHLAARGSANATIWKRRDWTLTSGSRALKRRRRKLNAPSPSSERIRYSHVM